MPNVQTVVWDRFHGHCRKLFLILKLSLLCSFQIFQSCLQQSIDLSIHRDPSFPACNRSFLVCFSVDARNKSSEKTVTIEDMNVCCHSVAVDFAMHNFSSLMSAVHSYASMRIVAFIIWNVQSSSPPLQSSVCTHISFEQQHGRGVWDGLIKSLQTYARKHLLCRTEMIKGSLGGVLNCLTHDTNQIWKHFWAYIFNKLPWLCLRYLRVAQQKFSQVRHQQ